MPAERSEVVALYGLKEQLHNAPCTLSMNTVPPTLMLFARGEAEAGAVTKAVKTARDAATAAARCQPRKATRLRNITASLCSASTASIGALWRPRLPVTQTPAR